MMRSVGSDELPATAAARPPGAPGPMSYRGDAAPWGYGPFMRAAIRAGFKRQFARSTLGAAWLILHPLARAAIFALVFSEVLLVRIPGAQSPAAYAVYLMAGMCAWGVLNDIVLRSTTMFVDAAATIRRMPVPLLCFPVVVACEALLNHALLVIATLVVLVAVGHAPGLACAGLVLALAVLVPLGLGIGLILGIANVFRRDIGHLTGIALQLWFWLTPIVYVAETLPANFAWLVDVNPLVPVVRVYQDALLHDRFAPSGELWFPIGIALAACVLALALFKRACVDVGDSL
jgi:lipopolysaccharide transport system permease protein